MRADSLFAWSMYCAVAALANSLWHSAASLGFRHLASLSQTPTSSRSRACANSAICCESASALFKIASLVCTQLSTANRLASSSGVHPEAHIFMSGQLSIDPADALALSVMVVLLPKRLPCHTLAGSWR